MESLSLFGTKGSLVNHDIVLDREPVRDRACRAQSFTQVRLPSIPKTDHAWICNKLDSIRSMDEHGRARKNEDEILCRPGICECRMVYWTAQDTDFDDIRLEDNPFDFRMTRSA